MQSKDTNIKRQRLVDYVMLQIFEYHKYGFKIVGIIGANRSPNCGVAVSYTHLGFKRIIK